MFKIRLEKKQICKQIKPIEVKAVNKEKAHAEVLNELEMINHIKEAFLERMGLNQEEYYKVA